MRAFFWFDNLLFFILNISILLSILDRAEAILFCSSILGIFINIFSQSGTLMWSTVLPQLKSFNCFLQYSLCSEYIKYLILVIRGFAR